MGQIEVKFRGESDAVVYFDADLETLAADGEDGQKFFDAEGDMVWINLKEVQSIIISGARGLVE
jgi:hypothetical protein